MSLWQLRMSVVGAGLRIGASPVIQGLVMDKGRAVVSWVLAALALGGCFGVPLHRSSLEEDLPKKTAPIVVGQTDRVEVRRVLGEPWVSSDYWGFDLFRVSDWNGGIAVLFVLVPIPDSEQVDGYLLVSYGAGGKVSAFDNGVTSSGSMLSAGSSGLHLVAADLGFIVEGDAVPHVVAVRPALRDQYLSERAPRDRCTVVVGCPIGSCGSNLSLRVDEGPAWSLPHSSDSVPPIARTRLEPETLAPGEHRLRLIEPKFRGGSKTWADKRIVCAAGEVWYALLLDSETSGTDDAIKLAREMPETFRAQPMLIWREGRWLVPQEPGR